MESKVCVNCNTENYFHIFHNKKRESKESKIKSKMKRYYINKDKISNQQKLFLQVIEKK